jgi:hypothetical protein
VGVTGVGFGTGVGVTGVGFDGRAEQILVR